MNPAAASRCLLAAGAHSCPRSLTAARGVPLYEQNTMDLSTYYAWTSVLPGHEAMNVISGQATWCLRKGYLVRSLFLFVFDNGSFRILTRKVQ